MSLRINLAGSRLWLLQLLLLVLGLLVSPFSMSTAYAVGSYDNATIANKALSYVGQWGGEACRAAGKLDSNNNGATVGGYGAGQCKTFVNCIVFLASGGSQYPVGGDYFQSFLNAGATEIMDINSLSKGDIVQVGQGTHTFIIVGKVSNNTFNVVDSNRSWDEKVQNYDRTFSLDSNTRAFRMGTVNTSLPPNLRIAYVNTSGEVWVKEGGITAGYTRIWNSTNPAVNVQLSPNRIAVVDASGRFWVNQWPLTATWTLQWSGVRSGTYQIADSNIAVLDNGTLKIKQGTGYSSLSNGWVNAGTSVVSFRMAQNGNLAAIFTNGVMYVGWGGYGSTWTPVASNLMSYDISNNVIGVVFNDWALRVMIGAPVNNYWRLALSNATSVQLSAGGNIAGVDTGGTLQVAWGGYGSSWTPVATNYSSSFVSDNMVAVRWGNQLNVKVGTASGPWTMDVANDTVAFAIS